MSDKFDTKRCVVSKLACLLTFELIFIVMAMMLYSSNFGDYGEVIDYETSLWNEGPIIDVVSKNYAEGCPKGYATVEGTFWGTATTCNGKVGRCKKGKFNQKEGAPQSVFYQFQNKLLCYKREETINYHTLADTRHRESCLYTKCGSPKNDENSFCVPGIKQNHCPLNSIEFGRTNESSPIYNVTTYNLQNGWNAYWQRDNDTYGPMVQMRYAFSRPCGNLNSQYDKREFPIHSVYSNGDQCSFEGNLGPEHDLFHKTEYSELEYDVYEKNEILDVVKEKASNAITFDPNALKLNKYSLFYRPYSQWKSVCQARYSTQNLAEQGDHSGNLSRGHFTLFLTVIFFIIAAALELIMHFDTRRRTNKACNENFIMILAGVQILLLLTILITFSVVINSMNKVDTEMLQFAVNNECSDGVLMVSLRKFTEEYTKQRSYVIVGLTFTLLSLISQGLINFKFGPKFNREAYPYMRMN